MIRCVSQLALRVPLLSCICPLDTLRLPLLSCLCPWIRCRLCSLQSMIPDVLICRLAVTWGFAFAMLYMGSSATRFGYHSSPASVFLCVVTALHSACVLFGLVRSSNLSNAAGQQLMPGWNGLVAAAWLLLGHSSCGILVLCRLACMSCLHCVAVELAFSVHLAEHRAPECNSVSVTTGGAAGQQLSAWVTGWSSIAVSGIELEVVQECMQGGCTFSLTSWVPSWDSCH